MHKPRVMLADDHALIIEGFRRILEDQYELVGTATDGRTLVESAKALEPDIIILDVSMPLLNGIDAAAHLRKCCPHAKLIFMTMHADTEYVRSAFEAAKDIANLLKISPRTVEFHKGQIMEHLKLQSTADLIRYALTHGIATAS